MAISTNSIIHYTDKIDSLIGIISEGFRIKYCSELMQSPDWRIHVMVPMISFCDIPFSSFRDHIQAYGSYGIGLSKSWALRKGINPVLYLSKGSSINKRYLDYMAETIPKKTKADIKALDFMKELVVYAKNYQADLERKDVKIKNYRFYNEREWRYILTAHDGKKVASVFGENKANKTSLNKTIEHARICFNVDEITYIIVNSVDEIEIVINAIRKAYNDRCTNKQLDILLSKIISVEQIKNDF